MIKLKIFYCIHGLYNSGGMERVLTEKVNFLKKAYNYDITIILSEGKNKKNFFHLDNAIKVINLDIGYHEINSKINRILKRLIIKLKERKHLKKFEKVVEKEKPDLIISLGDESRYICANKRIKAKKILEIHFDKKTFLGRNNKNIFMIKIWNIYKHFKQKMILSKYNKVVVLTRETKNEWLREKQIENIEIIPNPLPFYPKKVSNCENKTIISVGRLEEQKGYDELIEVWSKLFQKYPEWKLEIYGEGSLRKKLQQKIDELGMGTSLLLSGNNKNIMDRYLESSIYVMTSKYEGMPMVLLETMACGLPVVSFDCPCGPKDIIKDGEDGFLIRNRDLDEMAKKLEFLIQNETQRKIMGKKAHENIARYSKEKVMLQWKNLFEELVNNKEN